MFGRYGAYGFPDDPEWVSFIEPHQISDNLKLTISDLHQKIDDIYFKLSLNTPKIERLAQERIDLHRTLNGLRNNRIDKKGIQSELKIVHDGISKITKLTEPNQSIQ